jgi:hypothetical protein
MSITRIKNNQITDLTVNAAAKLQDFSITSGKIANNLTYGSDLTIEGNLTVQGNVTAIDTTDLVIEDPLFLLAKDQTGSPTLDIGFIGKRGTEDNIAWIWDESADQFAAVFTDSEITNTTINILGYANVKFLDVEASNLDITGNITFSGNIVGDITVTGNVDAGNFNATNAVTGVSGDFSGNVVVANLEANAGVSATTVSATGNVSGGNITTAGAVDATGNVSGGNITTAGAVDATGNVSGGNITTAGDVTTATVTASGNVDAANINATTNVTGITITASGNLAANNAVITNDVAATTGTFSGNVSADTFLGNIDGGTGTFTGNVSADTFLGNIDGNTGTFSGNVSADWFIGNIQGTTGNFSGNVDMANSFVTGNVTAGNLISTGAVIGNVEITGNLSVENITATGNITGNNLISNNDVTTATVTASGNVNGGNINAVTNVTATTVTASGNVDAGTAVNTDLIAGTALQIVSTGDLDLQPTGNISVSGAYIRDVADPELAQDAATKQYVDDAVSSGIHIHTPVLVETPVALPSATYANGGNTFTVNETIAGNTVVFTTAANLQVNDSLWFDNSFEGIVGNLAYFVVSTPNTSSAVLSTQYNGAPVSNITSNTGLTESVRVNSGVGATLTAVANGALIVDGVTLSNSDRVLVYQQSTGYENGVYVVTDAGNVSAPWILTRSIDADTYEPQTSTGLDQGSYFYVQSGDTGAGESYVKTAPPGPFIFGLANITFTQFSASQVYSANTQAGLVLNGTVFSAKVDNNTTAFDGGGNIIVKAGANLTTPNIGNATGNSLTLTGNGLLSATTINATGNVTGDTFLGNIDGTTGTFSGNVTGDTFLGNVDGDIGTFTGNVTASTFLGDIEGATGTFTGNVSADTFFGNIDGGTGTFTGNVSADTFVGNIDGGTGTFTGNVSGDTFLGNIDGDSGTFTGNVSGDTFLGNIDGGTGTFTGNVSGDTFLGNIDGATGLFTGNVTADYFIGNIDGNTGTFTGNVTADYFVGNVDGDTGFFSGNVTAQNFIGNISGNIDAGGANTEIQFNDDDILAGDANFTFDKSSGQVTISGSLVTDNVVVDGDDITSLGSELTINSAGGDVNFRVSGDAETNLFIVDAGSDTVLIGTATPTTGAALKVGTTDSILIPVGNAAQRPGTPVTGMLRFNTTDDTLEYYDSDSWEGVSTVFTIIVADDFTGDGSTVAFTLSQDSTTAATIVSINGVVQIPVTAYSVTGNVLTFTEAPESSDVIDARILTTSASVRSIENSSGNAKVETLATADVVEITGNLLPSANVTYNLGSTTARWNDLFLAGNTITLGNIVIKETTGTTIGFFEGDGTTPATIDAASVDTTSIANGSANIRTFENANVTVSAGGNANVGVFTGTGFVVTGSIEATNGFIGLDATAIANGTANVRTFQDANVAISAGGTSNVMIVTSTGANVTGTISATGNVSGGNLVTTGNVAAGNLIVSGIESVGTLNVSGDTLISGNLTVSGTTITANVATLVVTDPILGLGRGANGAPLTSNDGLDRGIEMFYYTTAENIAFMGFDNSEGKMLSASNVSVANNIVTVNSYGTTVVGTLEVGNIVNTNANGVGNIGSASSFFNTVHAKATSAQYADLAEMYEADAVYEPGTVLCFGGAKEVTLCGQADSTRVAGVVSTNPSYLMNSGQTGENVVALALTGRVPCRVTGTIRKGDLMVSTGDGRARANNAAAVGTVIGKALADFDGADGVIEVVVGRV